MNVIFTRSHRVLRLVALSVMLSAMNACSSVTSDVISESKSAKKQFFLGPEDVLEIAVWRSPDLTQNEVVVRPDGKIAMPLIGEVDVSGRTAKELAEHIAERLKEFKENPSVAVKVKEVNSYYVYVLGEAMKPGKYQLKSHATVLQAISIAGGFTNYASKNRMQVLRTITTENGQTKEFKIPAKYDELVSGEGEIKDFVLKTGDVVVVPSRVW